MTKYLPENARLQKNLTSPHLSHIVNNASQLRPLDCYITDLLLRMRGSPLGYSQTRSQMYGVWRQMPRKVQGPAQCRLPTE